MRVPKNIIFDLGGVLLNIDYSKTEAAFKQLGFQQFNDMYNQYTANDLFEKLETGNITEADFYARLLQISGKGCKREDITAAWNAMLLDFRADSLKFLEKLAANHRLFLLSNTNAIHHSAFMKLFSSTGYNSAFDQYFTKAWYSHEIGLRKPGREIFDFVMKDAGLAPADTLFIDDSYNNIEGARQAGLLTYLLQPGETIEEILKMEA